MSGAVAKEFTRGRRVTAQVNDATQKIVNQLSVLSASKKQPKLLKFCPEDIIKHRTIMNAWKLVKRRKQQKQQEQLAKQYNSIYNAMEDLKNSRPDLYEIANSKEKRFRFPLEMRVPTEYPPNDPWVYDYSPPEYARR